MKSPSAVSAVGSFARASPYGVNRIRYKSFFIPVLRFTVRTGLEIVTKHQSRHLLQAEREVVSARHHGLRRIWVFAEDCQQGHLGERP